MDSKSALTQTFSQWANQPIIADATKDWPGRWVGMSSIKKNILLYALWFAYKNFGRLKAEDINQLVCSGMVWAKVYDGLHQLYEKCQCQQGSLATLSHSVQREKEQVESNLCFDLSQTLWPCYSKNHTSACRKRDAIHNILLAIKRLSIPWTDAIRTELSICMAFLFNLDCHQMQNELSKKAFSMKIFLVSSRQKELKV